MGIVFDTMEQFFILDDWSYQRLEEDDVLRMGFRGTNGRWDCIARAREDGRQIIFYSYLATFVPEEKMPAVSEFLTRANYGLFIGNFELDYSDGEVRYKTSVDVEGAEDMLTPGIVRHLVYANVSMMDKYLPGIMKVIYSDVSPEEALLEVEEEGE